MTHKSGDIGRQTLLIAGLGFSVFAIKKEIGLFIVSYCSPLTGALITHNEINMTNFCAN